MHRYVFVESGVPAHCGRELIGMLKDAPPRWNGMSHSYMDLGLALSQ